VGRIRLAELRRYLPAQGAMRTLVSIWIVLLVVGSAIVGTRACKLWSDVRQCQYVAHRELPAGFHLGDGDWSAITADSPSIAGKYTSRHYLPNCEICAADVLAAPNIESKGANPVVLSVPAGPLNAGAIVDIYRNKKVAATNVPVLTVLCGAKDCTYVVVGIQNADMPAVTEGDAAPVLLIRKLP
jgi:hypothetical protein